MPSNLNQLINNFLEYLGNEKGKSSHTVKNYQFYLQRFVQWGHLGEPQDITVSKVEEFRRYLSNVRSQRGELMKVTTQNYHLIALRTFLGYLKGRDITTLKADQVTLTKTGRRTINIIEEADIERLLAAPLQTKEPGLIQKRDKAMLELLFSTGMRVSEIASLQREQINFLKDEFIIRGGGGAVRFLPLSNQTKYWLKEYLGLRTDRLSALFVRHDKARKKQFETIKDRDYRLTPRTVQRIVKKYAKSADIGQEITPHTLRHSYAAHLLHQGFDIKTIQSMLGHSSITTTQIYSRMADNKRND